MRRVGVVVLLILATVFGLVANAAVWANATIFDTDEFVDTASTVYQNEDVQVSLANRITTRIVVGGDLEGRIAEALPPGMQFLAAPLTEGAYDVVFRTTVRVLQAEATQEVLDSTLRVVHGQLMAILDNESALGVSGDSIILDVGQIVETVLLQLGVDDPGGLLANLNLPPDAGQIVLVEDASTASTVHQLIGLRNVMVASVVLATLAFFGAAIALSKNRRKTLRTSLILVLLIGLLGLLLLAPIRGIAASLTADENVGRQVFNDLLQGFRLQSFFVMLVAVVGLIVLFALGNSALATNTRAAIKTRQPSSGLRASVVQAAPWLRAGALVAAGFALVAWDDPSPRVYVTTLLALAAFIGGLTLITSEADWASRSRERVGGAWGRVSASSRDDGNWVARNAMRLRVGGLVVGVLLVVFWPTLSFASVAGIVALVLIYLAVIDYFAGRSPSEESDTPPPPPPTLPSEPEESVTAQG